MGPSAQRATFQLRHPAHSHRPDSPAATALTTAPGRPALPRLPRPRPEHHTTLDYHPPLIPRHCPSSPLSALATTTASFTVPSATGPVALHHPGHPLDCSTYQPATASGTLSPPSTQLPYHLGLMAPTTPSRRRFLYIYFLFMYIIFFIFWFIF